MKDFFKAYKLYFKASFSPVFFLFGTALFLTIGVVVVISASKLEINGYLSMMGTMGYASLLQILLLMLGKISITTHKFFMSVNSSRHLYTTAPIAAVLTVEFICGTILLTALAVTAGSQVVADALIILAIDTVLTCNIVAVLGMPKMTGLFIVSYLLLFSQPAIFTNDYFNQSRGFGLELSQAIIISAVILIVGVGINLLIVDLWWKKSGRSFKIVQVNNSLANIK